MGAKSLNKLMYDYYLEASASSGSPGDSAWTGTGDGSVVAILKAIHAQNAQMITLLNDIKTNTTPTP